jgi:acyl carrier protein
MTTLTTETILGQLQHAYDVVKKQEPRTLALDDHLVDDLGLDSLDVIDLVSVLEESFPPDVIDAVVDDSPSIATVQQLVDAFAAHS